MSIRDGIFTTVAVTLMQMSCSGECDNVNGRIVQLPEQGAVQ